MERSVDPHRHEQWFNDHNLQARRMEEAMDALFVIEAVWEHLLISLLPGLWEATYGLHYSRIQRQDIFAPKSDEEAIIFQATKAGM
eukprot:261242-Alexandrium_andersonii.AAC.1